MTNSCYDNTISANSAKSADFGIFGSSDTTDEPDEVITITVMEDPDNPLPDGVTISTTASTASITIRDDDPTIVTLARTGGTGGIEEGENVEFTVTLGRSLIAGEIIDVPLIVSGSVTTEDWSLAAKTGGSLNTGVTLVNEMTASPVVRFSGANAQTTTLLLTAAADNTAEAGGPEMLTLALGPNDDTANGFDLNTRMTNVGGGADPDGTDNTFNITINDDMTAPVPDVSPLKAITEQCSLTETQLNRMNPTATDNQMGTVRVTNDITNFPITSNTTITWTYTDPTGNIATQTQEVVIDVTAIIPNVPSLNELTAQCEIMSLTPPTAMNCSGESIMATTTTKTPIMGNTTITWTYTDAGNMTTQTQEVTIRDTMSPVPNPDNNLSPLTADCSIPATDVTIPTAMDNCDGRIMATTTITPPITASTTITWTYSDAAGNTATQTQEVIIDDDRPPTPNPSNDLSEISRQCPLMENELTTPAATDNCTGSVTVTNNIVTFPITSDTTITWTYKDGADNTATQTQQVTIADTTDPVPAVADLPKLEDCSQITSLNAPNATDNCNGTITGTTNTTPPITISTAITWTYTDDTNNTTTQTQQVTIGDTEVPVPNNSDLPVIMGDCPVAAMADLTVPTATDNCDGQIMASPDITFPITSTMTITWTYTDAAGNTATQTQEVICPLSASEDETEAVIFPNPSGNYLEVRSPVRGTFQLLSLSGKPLLKGTTNAKVDITSLQSGLYLVQLPDGRLLKFVRE